VVALEWQFVPYADVASGRVTRKNGVPKPAKTISVVDEGGRDLLREYDEAAEES